MTNSAPCTPLNCHNRLMGRRGDWLLVSMGLLLATGAGVGLVEVFLLPSAQRNDVVGFGGFALALASAVASILEQFRRLRRPIPARPVNTLTDLLAQGVYGQWRRAATERVLLTPPPIPIRWSLSPLRDDVELTAAIHGPFGPLPGQTVVTDEQLRTGGGQRELFEVYAGLASGRIVVVGTPGSGKSGSAILLLLDALEHRRQVGDAERAQVPVPVLFTVHGWDPSTCAVDDWLADQLTLTYPMFQHRGGQAEATTLVTTGSIALILDGLDEMDQAMRPAALQALSDAPFRLVVLTRTQEMVQATATQWLAGAVALNLQEVTGPEAADYLEQSRVEPPPFGWSRLLTHLREPSNTVLAHGLSTPLTLTLVRDTYRASDDINELLDPIICGTAEDLERHLLARVLQVAYATRPGRSKPRYSLRHATYVLTFLARQMNHNHTRDLAWWNIPRWAPTIPRILASMLASGLLSILLIFLTLKLLGHPLGMLGNTIQGYVDPSPAPSGWPIEFVMIALGIGLPFGAWYGRGGRAPKRVKNLRFINASIVVTIGLIYGLAGGLVVKIAQTIVANPDVIKHWVLAYCLWSGLVFGLMVKPVGVVIDGARRPRSLRERWRDDRLSVLLFGATVGLAAFFAFLLEVGNLAAIVAPAWALTAALMYWVTAGLAAGLTGRLVEEEETVPQSPRENWRNDRVVGIIIGVVVGLAMGLGYGLADGLFSLVGITPALHFTFASFRSALGSGLVVGIIIGITAGLSYGITSSSTWPVTLGWLQLQCSRRVPAVRLMRFLEDARNRGVLRTVGAVYQFRHATLQDHLAGQITLSPSHLPRSGARHKSQVPP